MAVLVRLATAHPFGGVSQKTVVSELAGAIVIEYETHFSQEILLTLHPDKDLDNSLDISERQDFLKRANNLLLPNIICKLGGRELELKEIDRKLILEDEQDFKRRLSTQFVWRVLLPRDKGNSGAFLRITDNNFQAGEMNQLSYFVTVLGDTGPIALAAEGRELILELSDDKRVVLDSDVQHASHSTEAIGHDISNENDNHVEQEAGSLIAFLKNESGGVGLYFVGFITAFILGALHALSPGHGKAMVAAYLVGTRGRVIDAVRLGIVVTVTHVISVIVLGIIALVLSQRTLSQDFYPWLGFASGVIIFLTGYFLLARTALANSHHSHHHHHDHHHAGEHHNHSLKEIISLGVAGGLVPCPSAIVILLFAVAVNRIATGLGLILSFSLGLAAVLILIGVLTVTASKRIEQLGAGVGWIKRLPVFTAGIIMVLGIGIGLNSLLRAGILTLHL